MNAKTVAVVAFLGLAFCSSAVAARERIYYFHNDHLGTPQVMTDQAGRVVWQAEYAPFGKATLNQDPDGDGQQVINNLRFPGQYFDAETGLHYNWHRTYDPETGRYLQPDAIGILEGRNHLYIYASNNPIRGTDATGLAPAFHDLNQAAIHAMRLISSFPDREESEIGGWITLVDCGHQPKYTYDAGRIVHGSPRSLEIDLVDEINDIAFFHSHTRYSPQELWENFSKGDRYLSKHDPFKLITGFLLTVSGRFLRFDPLDHSPGHGETYEIH